MLVLEMLAGTESGLGVSEMARRLGLNKSSISRLLGTLERRSFVERNTENGRFRLGTGLLTLLAPTLATRDAVRAARPILDDFASESGETVSIGLWNGREALMVEQTLGAHAVRHYARSGIAVPAHCTAAGKIFLAHLSKAELERFLADGVRRYTSHTLTDRAALLGQLDEVRRLGHAKNAEEYELEACGVAAPVWDFRTNLVAALAAAVPVHRFGPKRQRTLAAIVMRYAALLSQRLGYDPAHAGRLSGE